VILFSEDPAKWRPGYVQYAQMTASPKPSLESNKSNDTRPLESYRTRLTRMPPGQYLIVAIDDVDLGDPANTRALEKLRPLATPITLVAGQTPRIALRLSRPTRR
jgi:hypothetical protein